MNEGQFKKLLNINHWEFTHYRAKHKSGHIRWVASGFFFFTEDDKSHHPLKFSIWQRIELWNWIKWCMAEQCIIKSETN